MITDPTVLVLGAGASAPYGFPVASELKQKICDAFAKDPTATRFLHEGSEIPMNVFLEFREAFRKSGQSSVDAFLERRPDFIPVGKLAIAYCLIPYESEDAFFQPTCGGDWYQYLFGKLNASFEEFGQNKLSVITFNYDRSLEHFLLTTLQHSHGKTFDECADLLVNHVPIVHVYGQLSEHRYPHPEARQYSPDREPFEAVASAAHGIKILNETEPKFDEAHRLLADAGRICFLGFGYHELNIKRLAIDTTSVGSKYIYGTCRDLIGKELETAKMTVQQAIGSALELEGNDNLETLRYYRVLG